MKTWECKIGEVEASTLPDGADQPLRKAVEQSYLELTGKNSSFCFSGWGAALTEVERDLVNAVPIADVGKGSDLRIEVKKSEYSQLWYWRIYAGTESVQVPLIASNGYVEEAECRKNLELVRQAFLEGVAT